MGEPGIRNLFQLIVSQARGEPAMVTGENDRIAGDRDRVVRGVFSPLWPKTVALRLRPALRVLYLLHPCTLHPAQLQDGEVLGPLDKPGP